jgi:hypothetical protein
VGRGPNYLLKFTVYVKRIFPTQAFKRIWAGCAVLFVPSKV